MTDFKTQITDISKVLQYELDCVSNGISNMQKAINELKALAEAVEPIEVVPEPLNSMVDAAFKASTYNEAEEESKNVKLFNEIVQTIQSIPENIADLPWSNDPCECNHCTCEHPEPVVVKTPRPKNPVLGDAGPYRLHLAGTLQDDVAFARVAIRLRKCDKADRYVSSMYLSQARLSECVEMHLKVLNDINGLSTDGTLKFLKLEFVCSDPGIAVITKYYYYREYDVSGAWLKNVINSLVLGNKGNTSVVEYMQNGIVEGTSLIIANDPDTQQATIDAVLNFLKVTEKQVTEVEIPESRLAEPQIDTLRRILEYANGYGATKQLKNKVA